MTMFGLKEAEVAQLVRDVAGEQLDREAIEARFARSVWTALAEPGDRDAGRLVAAIGAPQALTAIIERRTPADLAAIVGDDGGDAETMAKAIDRWLPRVDSNAALIALRQAARFGASLRVPGDPAWPVGVDDLGDHAPIALWTRGSEDALRATAKSIALVGARAATGYGEHVTMEASAGLVDRGYAIVSGAAYGIDGMAHRAALASSGTTVAFLAGGVDRFYPAGHDALLTRIVASGAVVSELPPGSAPTKWRFLQRNRLIAASSLATVVLEAGAHSGSLNTARHADNISRPIGAVPGPVTSAASAGCHYLVRELGATLVTGPEDMAELAPLQRVSAGPASAARDPDGTRVLDALNTRAPRDPRDIAVRSGLAVADVEAVLGRLELQGDVRDNGRGWLKAART